MIAAVMTPATAALAATSACPDTLRSARYADVDGSNTHSAAIDCVSWWEISTGSGFGTYQPGAEVRRDQMATFIARLVESIGGDLPAYGNSDFEDVDYSNAHRENISRLADVGLVQGTGGANFSPAAVVTRAQMATFLVRAAEFARNEALPVGPDAFQDDNGNSHEANINKAAQAGFATGVAPRQYRPNGAVRRDQMATFLSRVLTRSVDLGDTVVPVEQISFEQTGDELTPRFRLRSGAEYRATYDFRDDCYYGQHLDPEDEDVIGQSLGSGQGPTSGQTTITDVEAATYRILTFTSADCSWTLALSRVR